MDSRVANPRSRFTQVIKYTKGKKQIIREALYSVATYNNAKSLMIKQFCDSYKNLLAYRLD